LQLPNVTPLRGVIYADSDTVYLMAEVEVIRLLAGFLGPRVNLGGACS